MGLYLQKETWEMGKPAHKPNVCLFKKKIKDINYVNYVKLPEWIQLVEQGRSTADCCIYMAKKKKKRHTLCNEATLM